MRTKTVGDGEVEAEKVDALALEPAGTGVNPPTLDARIGEVVELRLSEVADPVRHLQYDRQSHTR